METEMFYGGVHYVWQKIATIQMGRAAQGGVAVMLNCSTSSVAGSRIWGSI
jgi:hypothetical protein